MKILFFVHRYWPAVGGVEKYIHELSRALLAKGHAVDVIAGATEAATVSNRGDSLGETEIHEGVVVHRFPALRSPLRARWWLLRHLGLFHRADVIHVSNTHMLEYLARMLGPLVDRRKTFLTRHGLSYRYPVPPWEKRRAVRTLKLAAAVVHDGAFIEKWLEVKPDLAPDQGLSPSADELVPVPEPPPTSAVFIGRLEPDSGIGIYLDAVKILTHKMHRSFCLQVYGDGSLATSLRERAASESLPVRFHGRTHDAQQHITDSCFAFIDGRMAIQEAMARRRLVFPAYVDPLKRDYVGTESFSPYLIPVGSGKRLAERVAYFADRPEERSQRVEQAYRHARTLTWERTAETYLRLWRQKLAQPRLPCSRREFWRLVLALHREVNRPKNRWACGAGI